MRHQPRTLHPLHRDTQSQSQQARPYTTPAPQSLSFRAASLPLPDPIDLPPLTPSKHDREASYHSKRLRKAATNTPPSRREKGKDRGSPCPSPTTDRFWADVWAGSSAPPAVVRTAAKARERATEGEPEWPELPARVHHGQHHVGHGRGGRATSTEVKLADLIRPAKSGKKPKDPDFELVPHVRSVIVLDDSSAFAPGEPESDEPWEYLSSVALSDYNDDDDDDTDERSRTVLSYAEIVAKTH
ncbi:hypothetical protein OF83DRAFT_1175884 [Amylostereum chailletii]|nr:hypothetical protein OF83DRAFT_1175884 [Amylostereum chailletii]